MQWPNHDIQPPRKPHGSRIDRRIQRYPPPVSGNAEPSSMYAMAVNIVTTKFRPNARTSEGPVIAKPGPTSRKMVVPIVGPSPIIVISRSPRSRRNLTSTSRPCAIGSRQNGSPLLVLPIRPETPYSPKRPETGPSLHIRVAPERSADCEGRRSCGHGSTFVGPAVHRTVDFENSSRCRWTCLETAAITSFGNPNEILEDARHDAARHRASMIVEPARTSRTLYSTRTRSIMVSLEQLVSPRELALAGTPSPST